MSDHNQNQDQCGELLYYKYIEISDLNSLSTFYYSNCNLLGLIGRIRLPPDGVNVTVGGKLSSLESHIAAVKSICLFEGTDFKLASSHYPLDDKVAHECGFTSLPILIVKELFSFSSHPLLNPPDISNAGRHLSAAEFHSVLQSARIQGNLKFKKVQMMTRNLLCWMQGICMNVNREVPRTKCGNIGPQNQAV